MRRLSFFLLLATAAAPALAAPGDHDRGSWRHSDGNSTEQSDSRPQRAQENHRERGNGGEQRNVSVERSQRDQVSQQGGAERTREHYQGQHDQAAGNQTDSQDRVRTWRAHTDTQSSGWQQRQREIRTIPNTEPVVTHQTDSRREAYRDHNRRDYRDGNYTKWSNNWRHNDRYDWYNYRNHHRSTFRVGIYYDPFGWNYRRWSIGSYLYPSYYDSGFWLDDPWAYRLPPAYGPYRWVRYWDDALMVNIYTGQVVDVIHNFFW